MKYLPQRIGKLYSKGIGLFGALGLGDVNDSTLFRAVDLESLKVKQISAGWGHSAVITDTDRLLVFGRPYEFHTLMRMHFFYKMAPPLGRLVSSSSNVFGVSTSGLYTSPMVVDTLFNVKQVVASAGFTITLDEQGHVYLFGVNKFGQCALTEKTHHVYIPSRASLPNCTAIDAGLQHAIALTASGEVFCWGKGKRGQLGQGTTRDEFNYSTEPLLVKGLLNVTSISSGFNHCAALCEDGSLFIWGKHMSLDRKEKSTVELYNDQLEPRLVDLPPGVTPVEICSSNFALVIRCSNGTLWAMGLGEMDRNTCPVPLQVLSDFNANVNTELATQDIPVLVSEGTRLRKGYNRVLVIDPKRDYPFEVIMHNREAYGREPEGVESFLQEVGPSRRKILDYSTGWKHSLAVIEDEIGV